jgi:hypothetical protein
MLRIYRCLLHLYPAVHREQFGDEMTAVFEEVQAETATKGITARAFLYVRETAGLLAGALQQHVRALGGARVWLTFPTRGFTMRTEFRFPKTTAVLMIIILAGVLLVIEKGEGIEASLARVSPPGSIVQTNMLPGIAIGLACFYAAGFIGWAILFALRRSGVHRLDDVSVERK